MKLDEVNWLRFIAIVSVVIWHCFVCPICIWEPLLLEKTLQTKLIHGFFYVLMPESGMPLFISISGYLFRYLYESKKKGYTKFFDIVKNKFHRLVIPFFVLGTLANLSVPERPFVDIIFGGGSSLWFCIVLFWCTMYRFISLKINNNKISGLLCLVVLFTYLSMKTNYHYPHFLGGIPVGFLGLNRGIYFCAYFILGEYLWKYKRVLYEISSKVLFLLFCLYLALAVLSVLKVDYVSYLSQKVWPILQTIIIFTLVLKALANKKLKGGLWLQNVCSYSFGIYVFHEQFAWNCYHNSKFLAIFRKNPIFIGIIFSVITFYLFYVITKLSLKTRVGRFFLS